MNMDDRIGKHGKHKPKTTLSGQPIPPQVTMTIGLGDGYYVVLTPDNPVDYEELTKLKGMINSEPERKPKRGKDSSEEDSSI